MRRLLAVAILAAICFGSSADADVVNVNVTSGNGTNQNVTLDGTASGAAVAPIVYTGTTWNDFGDGLAGPNALLTSDNVASGITLTRTNTGGNSGPGFTFSHTTGGAIAYDNYLAVHNGFGPALAAPVEFQLSGLDDALTYNLTFLSAGDTAGQGGSFTINGTTVTTSGTTIDGSSFIEGDNIASFTGLTSTGGLLDIDFSTGPGNDAFAVINGFQLEFTPVPEPSSLALLGLVGIGLLVRRRN